MKRFLLLASCVLLFASCTPEPVEVEVTREVLVEVPVTVEVPIEFTRIYERFHDVLVTVEVPFEVTREVQVIATQTPEPVDAAIVSLSGNGNAVTANWQYPACVKGVFDMTHDGSRNFIVRIYRSSDNANELMVNEIGAVDDSFLQPLNGGEYYFEVTADGDWSIDGVCDN